MKKSFIILSVLLILLIAALSACSERISQDNITTTVVFCEETTDSYVSEEITENDNTVVQSDEKQSLVQTDELTTIASSNSQIGIVVDNWLKILAITEYNGVLSVLAENVSVTDVEYALLTVKADNETLSFNVSAMLHGTTALLICNEAVPCADDTSYTFWQTENRTEFSSSTVMNDDKIAVTVYDGSISVENISGSDIENEIFIYYKDKINNTLNGSVTHRIRVAPLQSGAKTFINTKAIDENNCEIIFTQF